MLPSPPPFPMVSTMRKLLLCLFALLVLAGCRNTPTDTALGTIEWDRVELVATAAEPSRPRKL